MTFEEFLPIADAIRHYYPKEPMMPNKEAVMLWYEELSDLDAAATKLAVRKWAATSKWPPTIADIREQVAGFTTPKIKDWSEAFEDARRAVRRFGSYNPTDALNSLDDLTRETVKRLGYHDLCVSENHAADRANFRMIYEQLAKRESEERQINKDVKAMIAELGARLGIGQDVNDAWEKEKEQKRLKEALEYDPSYDPAYDDDDYESEDWNDLY